VQQVTVPKRFQPSKRPAIGPRHPSWTAATDRLLIFAFFKTPIQTCPNLYTADRNTAETIAGGLLGAFGLVKTTLLKEHAGSDQLLFADLLQT